jgi:hypothetical protein
MNTKLGTDHRDINRASVAIFLLDALLVLLILLLIYTLTFSGAFRIDDEHILVARAQSLAFWDHVNYPQVYGNDRVRHLSTVLEQDASPVVAIEPGQAVLGSFVYKLASGIDVGGAQAYFAINLYATALAGAVIYVSVRVLGFKRRTAFGTAFLYGIATMSWPYSKTAFRDPLAATMSAFALLGWVTYVQYSGIKRRSGFFIFLVGTLGGLFFKSNVLVLLPAFLISGLLIGYNPHQRPRIERKWVIIGLLPIMLLTIFAVTVSNPGPLSRFSISYYFDSAVRYWKNLNFQSILATLGPFFSPAKSIFLFNPVYLLLPWIIFRSWQRMKQIILPSIVSVILLSVFQALHLRELWAGNLIWGLRFFLPVLPMLTILLAPWLEVQLSPGLDRSRILGWFLIGMSVLVQLAGALVAWNIPFQVWYEKGLDPVALDAVWRLDFLVIPIHLRNLLSVSSWDVGWIRSISTQAWAWSIPVLILVFLVGLFYLLRSLSLKLDPERSKRILLCGTILLIGILPIFPTLRILKMDPGVGGGASELSDAVLWIEENVKAGDLVVVDSYGTDLWKHMMNEWDAHFPWYSLPFDFPSEEDPLEEEFYLVQQLGTTFNRVIYITTDEVPNFGQAQDQNWLGSNTKLSVSEVLIGDSKVQVSIYLPSE